MKPIFQFFVNCNKFIGENLLIKTYLLCLLFFILAAIAEFFFLNQVHSLLMTFGNSEDAVTKSGIFAFLFAITATTCLKIISLVILNYSAQHIRVKIGEGLLSSFLTQNFKENPNIILVLTQKKKQRKGINLFATGPSVIKVS